MADYRPNVLVAIAEDRSWPHAGAFGCSFVRTPAFDRVAREGVLFTTAFCPAPAGATAASIAV
jgi:N-sulfoglucosamine sulfohydrolase